MKKLIFIILFFSFVFAIDYFVSGDQLLQDTVDKVFADWQGLEPKLELEKKEDAKNQISYGKTELFGPDAYSLSIQEQGDDSKIKVLINPSIPELLERVVYHETGLLIGLEASRNGIMNPAIADKSAKISEEEATRLANLYKYDKADLNQDGSIDFYDLIEFSKAYGQQGINSRADLNSDGTVDSKDLEILKSRYVFGSPSASAPMSAEESWLEQSEAYPDLMEDEYLDLLDNPEEQEQSPQEQNSKPEEQQGQDESDQATQDNQEQNNP